MKEQQSFRCIQEMYQPCSWRHLNCTHFECLLYPGVSTNELIQVCLIRKSSKLWSTEVAPGTGLGNTDVSNLQQSGMSMDFVSPLLVQNFLQHAATLAGAAGALEA